MVRALAFLISAALCSAAIPTQDLVVEYRLDEGSGSTAANAVDGSFDLTLSSGVTWAAHGLTMPSGAAKWATGTGSMSMSVVTSYVAAKWDGSGSFDTALFTLTTGFAQNFGLYGVYSNTISPQFFFGGQGCQNAPTPFKDSAWHVIAGVYDGTALSLYMDGTIVCSRTVSASVPVSFIDLTIGTALGAKQPSDGPRYFGYALIYSAAHSPATVLSTTNEVFAIMGSRGVTISTPKRKILWNGDSITAGYAVSGTGFPMLVDQTAPITPGINVAVSGSVISDLVSRSAVNLTYFDTPAHPIEWVLVTNGIGGGVSAATYFAALKSFCLAEKAAKPGLRIVLGAIPPRRPGSEFYTTLFNPTRNEINALIRADTSFYDALADFDLDPLLGCDECAVSPYYPDGTHPAAIAQPLLAVIIQRAMAQAYATTRVVGSVTFSGRVTIQ